MKFKAEIEIMPHDELLDPQGKTIKKNLDHVDIHGVRDVRIGKHIRMVLDADSEEKAKATVESACKKILANVIMESYSFSITPVDQ